MKRNRYDLNDRHAYDGRPTRDTAKSPRTPASIRTSGQSGRNGADNLSDPTAGTHGNTARVRRPKRNTMRGSKQGGEGIYSVRKYAMPDGERVPAEWAKESLTYGDWQAPKGTPANGTRYDSSRDKDIRATNEAEGLRRQAMSRHSLVTRHGAVGVRTEMMRLRDGTWPNGQPRYRLVPIDAPVFSDDPTDTEE